MRRPLPPPYSALFEWVLFLVWIPVAFRLCSGTGATIAGTLDDLSVVAAGLLLFAGAERAPRLLRAVALTASAGFLIVAHLSSVLFFRFFQTFIGAETLAFADTIVDGRSSILALVTTDVVVGFTVVPLILFTAALGCSVGYGRRRATPLAIPALAGLVLLFGARSVIDRDFFVAAEENPLAFLVRDLMREAKIVAGDTGLRRMEITVRRDDTYQRSDAYVWAEGFEHPLWKMPARGDDHTPNRWNVIFVVMESMRGHETGLSGEPSGIAPNLGRLARQGLHFTNFYFNAAQTAHADVATLCGLLPDQNGIVFVNAPDLSLRCLPAILRDRGWTTYWINAFSSTFTGAGAFLRSHGIDHVLDERDVRAWGPKRVEIGWGIADEDVFDFTLETLVAAPEPFFVQVLTMSNHFPWDVHAFSIPVPQAVRAASGSEEYRGYLMGMHYTDHAVGEFMRRAEAQPWFRRTIFVFLGDHAVWLFPPRRDGKELAFLTKIELFLRGGMVIWAPGLVPARRSDLVGSQIDVAPTILDLLGIASPNSFQGVSLLAHEIAPALRSAVAVGNTSWNVRRGNAYCYALGQTCFADAEPRCPPDVDPQSDSHACFRFDGDLLDHLEDPPRLEILRERPASFLRALGRTIVDDTSFLVRHDALSPSPGS